MGDTIDSQVERETSSPLVKCTIASLVAATIFVSSSPDLAIKTVHFIYGDAIANAVCPKHSHSSDPPQIRYEYAQTQQLAESALKNYENSPRCNEELRRMDRNQNGIITEDEVIAYVRGK